MVRGKKTLGILCAALLVALFTAVLLSAVAFAQEEDEDLPTIKEEYSVKIDNVGDAHITDTFVYDSDYYNEVKKAVKEYPKLLSRRYTSDTDIGEVVNFDTTLDDSKKAVVVSFDSPGYCYNMKDYWVAYGFYREPKATGKVMEFESKSVANSEFTLMKDANMVAKTTVALPPKATNPRWDSSDKAIKYDMPPEGTLLGFWSENRTTLMIVFGVLALFFLLLLALVYRRKPVPAAAGTTVVVKKTEPGKGVLGRLKARKKTPAETPAASPSTVDVKTGAAAGAGRGASPPTATVGKAQAGEKAEPASPQTVTVGGPAKDTKLKFCRSCGTELPPGKTFCTHCGARQ